MNNQLLKKYKSIFVWGFLVTQAGLTVTYLAYLMKPGIDFSQAISQMVGEFDHVGWVTFIISLASAVFLTLLLITQSKGFKTWGWKMFVIQPGNLAKGPKKTGTPT